MNRLLWGLSVALIVCLGLSIVGEEAHAQNSTSTSVTCSPSTVVIGEITVCTATVSDTGGTQTPSTPTGDVSYSTSGSGSFNPTTCTLSPTGGTDESSCDSDYAPDGSPGTHTITGAYTSDDADHNDSQDTFDLAVNKADTTTTITSDSSDPSVAGETITVQYDVTVDSPGSGSPSGTVTVTASKSGASDQTCSGSVSAGQCSLSLPEAGTWSIEAQYGGDDNFNASTSLTESHTVNPRSTSTSLSCPSAAVIDETVSCTAAVSDGETAGTSSTPIGTVSFSTTGSGSFPSGDSCSLSSGQCSVDYQPAGGDAGTQTVTADYEGSSVHDTSSDNQDVSVSKRSTNTAVDCSPNPVVADQTTTCTATVTDNDPDGTLSDPDGTVTFTRSGDGSGNFSGGGTCNLLGTGTPGESSCDVNYTPDTATGTAATSGTHTITGDYDGSPTHATSGDSDSLTVDPRSTSTSVSCSIDAAPDFVQAGSATTCTATVTDTEDDGTASDPSGTITFSRSGPGSGSFTSGGSCNLSSTINAGESSCTVDYTPSSGSDGTHTISVGYSGSSTHDDGNDSVSLEVDGTPPGNYAETLGSPNHDSGTTVFVKSSTDISVTADDGSGSGIASCTLSIDGGSANGYTLGTNFSLPSGDGVHSYTVECTDNVGNNSSFARDRTVDDTPPGNYSETIGSPSFNDGSTIFVKSSTSISVDGDDNTGADNDGSGIASCQLQIAGGGFTSYDSVGGGALTGNNFTLPTPDGAKSYDVNCTDQLGNISGDFSRTRTVDDSPPGNYVLSIGSPSYAAGGTTYVASPTNPDLSATPLSVNGNDDTGADSNGAGIDNCQLDIDDTNGFGGYGTVAGGILTGNTFNLVSPDGPKNWRVRCTDNLGNQSTDFTQSLTVDDTPPEIDAPRHQNTTCHPAGNCGSGSETLVANTYAKAQDQASVVSNYPSVPASLFDYPGFRDPDAWANPGSGVDQCVLSGTQSDTGNYAAGTDFRTAPGDGPKTFELSCDDNLGNNDVEVSLSLNVDDTPPEIPNNLSHDNTTCWPAGNCSGASEIVPANVFVKAQDKQPFDPGSMGLPLENPLLPAYPTLVPKSTFQWEQTDAGGTIADPASGTLPSGSGLRDCVLTGGTTIDNTIIQPPFSEVFNVIAGDGTRTFQDNCRDNLGNQAETNANPVRVDDTPPSATFTTAGPRYDSSDGVIFIKSTTQITPILSDGSGVGVDLSGEGPPDPLGSHPTCQQNIDQNSGLVQPCLTPFTFPPPDQDHGFWIMRPDKLGNVDISFFPFVVDDTEPRITVDQPTEQARYVLNEEVLAQWEVTDDISFFEDGQESPFNPGLDPRGSGIRDLRFTTADGQPIDTDNVGAQAFNILAIDNLGHQNAVTITYQVVYAFELTSAFAEGLDDGPFAAGEPIELSFSLEDANGVFQSGAQPQVRLMTAPDEGEAEEIDFGEDPALAQLNDKGDRYVYELATDGLDPGNYQILIEPGDGTTRTVALTLEE